MIGKLYTSITPFFDVSTGQNSFKSRPVLIIGDIRSGDYTVLPVSRVTKRQYIDFEYDIEVKKSKYPKLCLTADSYIRVHKQTVVNKASLRNEISDLKAEYEDLYLEILAKLEQFNKELQNNAL